MLRFLFRDIPYRIHIRRRLILTSLALVGLGAAGAQLVDPARNPFADPQALLALLWVWGAVLVLNAVIFPAGWIDALLGSLALAILIVPSPLFLDDLAEASKGAQPMSPLAALLSAMAIWYALFCVLVLVFCKLGSKIKMGQRRQQDNFRSTLPPEALRRALSVSPNLDNGVRRCGPVDWTGWFPVSFTAVEPDPDGFRLSKNTHRYKARIVRDEAVYKLVEYQMEIEGRTSTGRVEEWFEPDGTGTRYRMQEIHDHFDLPTALSYWLCDFGADHTRALLDAARGRTSPAIFTKPQRTATTSLARLFSWRRAPT